jgi:hypothetical protein
MDLSGSGWAAAARSGRSDIEPSDSMKRCLLHYYSSLLLSLTSSSLWVDRLVSCLQVSVIASSVRLPHGSYSLYKEAERPDSASRWTFAEDNGSVRMLHQYTIFVLKHRKHLCRWGMLDLYSAAPRFDSHTRHRLSGLRYITILIRHLRKCKGSRLLCYTLLLVRRSRINLYAEALWSGCWKCHWVTKEQQSPVAELAVRVRSGYE